MSYSKIALAIIASAALAAGTVQVLANVGIADASAAIRSEQSSVEASIEELQADTIVLDATAATLDATIAVRQAVLAERDKFIAAVGEAQTAIDSAKDKVDVATQRDRILVAQNAVKGQLEDFELIVTQTADVVAITGEINGLVAEYDTRKAEEARQQSFSSGGGQPRAANPNPGAGGGGDWIGEMRNRLNNVGGGHVQLFEYDGNCSGAQSPACAYMGRGIGVNSSIMGFSDSRKNWAMVHELAHMYQYNVWSTLVNSGSYQNLFGGNIELLANCMASAKGYTNHGHNNQCTADRLDYGRSIWAGIVP